MMITMKRNTSSLPITLLKMKERIVSASPIKAPPVKHAPQTPDTAQHEHHVGVDRVRETHGGRDRLDRRQHRPGDPCKTRAKGEDRHVDPRRVDAEAARDRPVAAHRSHLEPEIGLENHIKDQEEQQIAIPIRKSRYQGNGSRPMTRKPPSRIFGAPT